MTFEGVEGGCGSIRPVIPDHIALRAQNASVKKLPHERKADSRRGRQANHPYIVLFDGWCEGSEIHKHGINRDTACCTTRYYGGLTLSELQCLGATRENTKIRLEVFFTGCCIHEEGKEIGSLRGAARARKRKQVSITVSFGL